MRLLTLLALLAVPCLAAPLPMETYLQPETLSGCVITDGLVRLPDPLPTQQGAAAIAVEGEQYASVAWQNEQGKVIDAADAGGGQAVAFAAELLYHFTVTRPGYYHYWQRAWIPMLASWTHGVQIDDQVPFDLAFGTRPSDQAKVWFWVSGPRHYLTAGVHTLAIRNLHNGKRIDRFVLTPDEQWRPEGTGPVATPIRETNEGEYLSRPLSPVSLQRWVRLPVQVQREAEVSLVVGDQRIPLPGDGSLGALAGPLRLRVGLRRSPGQPSPTVRLGAVAYEAEGEAFVVLRNAGAELLLDKRTGRVCGLRDLRTGRRVLPDGAPAALFELETKAYEAPAITRLSSDDATVVARRADVKTAEYVYALENGKLRVKVRWAAEAGWTIRASATVENGTDRDVIAVQFPRLSGAQCGQDGTDDSLAFPSMSGQIVPRPGRAGTLTNSHPMRAAIGFCDLFDARGGLTLAASDFPMVYSEFASEPSPGGESVCLSLTRRDRIRPGGSATYNATCGVHPGDWHTAADWYRQWFDATVGKTDLAAWVYDSDGWVTAEEPENLAGLGFIHMQMWRETGHGACPTYYYPNPKYRSERGFRDLAREFRALGGHLGVYFHGNSLSRSYTQATQVFGIPYSDIPAAKRPPDWDWFVRNSAYGPERKAPEPMDMSQVAEPADAEEYPGMAWLSPEWQGYLRKWALDVYAREYGLDTPYWDTLACWDGQGYNPFLRQNGEGRDSMARFQFLKQMQVAGRRVSPGFQQTVEGGSELLGLVAGQLESNFVQNLEVARYTHPQQIHYVGHSNGWWDPPKSELSAAMAFWLNARLDIIRLTPGVMDIVRTRRWFAPWLYHARFMDNLGLALSSDRVKGALHLYTGTDGKALIATFMNWQKIDGQQATVDVGRYLGGREVRAFLVTSGSEPQPLAPAGAKGTWKLALPVTPVSAVLFLERPAAAQPVVQAWQEQEKLRVRVFDPARKPRTWQVKFTSAEARLEERPSLRGSGQATTGADLSYTDFPALTRRLHADVTLVDGKAVLHTRALVSPRFEDPGFERALYDASQHHGGQRSLRVDPGGLTHAPLELVPGRKYRISLWVLRQEQVGSVMANVHLHLTNQSHHFGGEGKPGVWTRVETVYEMKGPEQPHLYLYNWQGTTQPAWFDDVRVEEIATP